MVDSSVCYWCDARIQDCNCDLGLTPTNEKEYCVSCGVYGTTYRNEGFICQQCDDVQDLAVSRANSCDDDFIAYLTRWAD